MSCAWASRAWASSSRRWSGISNFLRHAPHGEGQKSILGILAGGLARLRDVRLLGRHLVVLAEPAVEVGIGAPGGAEGVESLLRGLAADRAGPPRPQAHRLAYDQLTASSIQVAYTG